MNAKPNQCPSILVAEDFEDDVFFLRRALKKINLDPPLIVARDGVETIDYLSNCCPPENPNPQPLPDLLLLDLNMPRLNGFDVLAWLKDRPAFDSLVVVVFSSSDLESDRQRARELGADDYCVKPSQIDHLEIVIKNLFARWFPLPTPLTGI